MAKKFATLFRKLPKEVRGRAMSRASADHIDVLAGEFVTKEALLIYEQGKLDGLRRMLIELVLEHGEIPPRASKLWLFRTKVHEVRVTKGTEITIDTRVAKKLKQACLLSGDGRVFRKLFRKVETFVLAGGAHQLIKLSKLPPRAPRNLRSLFARAIQVRELAPQLEVRKLEKKGERG
jgi:hypothetical protein